MFLCKTVHIPLCVRKYYVLKNCFDLSFTATLCYWDMVGFLNISQNG